MWFLKGKNLFALDFNNFLNISNKVSIPNINDEIEEFDVFEYKMIENNSSTKTLHGFNKRNNIIITIYSNYISYRRI